MASPRHVDLDDVKAMSRKYSMRQTEKEIQARVKKELRERAQKMLEADKLREARFIEVSRQAEEDLLRRMLENERELKAAIAAHERATKDFEDSLKMRTEESKKRVTEMKQRSQVLEKFRALHELFKRSIERFMKSYTAMDKDMQYSFSKYKSGVFQVFLNFQSFLFPKELFPGDKNIRGKLWIH